MGQELYFMSDLADLLNSEEGPDRLEVGETYEVDIPIFREGEFEHPWYGELDFGRDYLEGLLVNFKAGVFPQKVSFDVSHEPDKGAIAWIEDPVDGLFIKEKVFSSPFGSKTLAVLYAKAELTAEGYSLIKSKKFRYFSSEIHPNYSTYERYDLNGKDDVVIRHGPTLIGGGLTNRPFIPGLGEIELSTGKDSQGLDYKFSERNPIEGSFLFMRGLEKPAPVKEEVVNGKENVPEDKGTAEDIEHVALSVEGVSMKFSELIEQVEKFSTPKEQVEYMNSVRGNVAGEDMIVFSTLLQAKEQAVQAAAQAEDAIQRKLAAEAKAQAAEASVVKLSNDLAEAKEGNWQSKVRLFCEDLHKQNHHASAVNTVEKILLSLKTEHREMKFSTIDGDATKDFQILDLLTAVFSSLPTSARLDESEKMENSQLVEVHPEAQIKNEKAAAEFSAPEEETDAGLQARIQKFSEIHGFSPAPEIAKLINEDGYII